MVPVYQAECAPKQLRGLIISAYQFFIAFGLLIAAVVVNSTKDMQGAPAFQIPIAIQFVWAAIIGGGVLLLPESPRYLLMKNKVAQGQRSLARLINQSPESPECSAMYAEIMANLEHERKNGGATWFDCFLQGESKALQRITTGMVMQALNQLSGVSHLCMLV